MEVVESDPESMLEDEIMLISGMMMRMLTLTRNFLLLRETHQCLGLGSYEEVQANPYIQCTKVKPLGHLPRRINFLAAHVHNLGKSLPDKFADTMDVVLPRAVAHALEERLPELLSDTMHGIIEESLNPVNKQFNVLNTLECHRLAILKKSICKSIYKNVRVTMGEVVGLLGQTTKPQMQLISYLEQVLHSTMKVPNDLFVINAKYLTNKVNRTSSDMNELVGLVKRVVRLMKSSPPPVNVAAEGEKIALVDPSTTEPHMTDDDHPDTLLNATSEPTQGDP
ncbi:hypothetical protein Tco_1402563 [Tanacetum coccineum]